MASMEVVAAQFHARVYPEPNSGCWLWDGAAGHHGYGQMRVHGRAVYAHRLSYELHNGPITGGLHVCHRCDVPGCVNPAHLFLGTPKDNCDDKIRKGRMRTGVSTGAQNGAYTKPHMVRRGVAHGMSKLTPEMGIEIVARRAAGEGPAKIGADLGLSRLTVWRVCAGRNWASPKVTP